MLFPRLSKGLNFPEEELYTTRSDDPRVIVFLLYLSVKYFKAWVTSATDFKYNQTWDVFLSFHNKLRKADDSFFFFPGNT